MSKPFTIIYIVGRGHSGSTLLDLLVSSHSEVTSVGEVKSLSSRKKRFGRKPLEEECTCGAAKISDCTFWRHIDAKMIESDGLSLWDVDVYGEDSEIFEAHNTAVFNAVSEITGCRFIVDSSKDIDRLEKLLKAKVFDIRPIHLIRSPYGVVFSNMKKGRVLTKEAYNYTKKMMRARRILSGHNHFTVHYETLTTKPSQTLYGIMNWLGLSFEQSQLDWSSHDHHNIAGNRMRFSKNNDIRPDTSWKQGLNPLQKTTIAWMTLPTRLPETWLFKLFSYIWYVRKLRKCMRNNMLILSNKISDLY